MSAYQVPPDTSAKEKIVGGILTGQQLAWILAGVGADAVFSFITFGLFGNASIIIWSIIFLPIGVLFALKKMHELTLFDYIIRKIKHMKKVKHLPNIRKEAYTK